MTKSFINVNFVFCFLSLLEGFLIMGAIGKAPAQGANRSTHHRISCPHQQTRNHTWRRVRKSNKLYKVKKGVERGKMTGLWMIDDFRWIN